MSIVDDLVTGPPFWDEPLPEARCRINGSQSHHCDICPIKDGEICSLACHDVRGRIADGIDVTF
jgi:hypothetical protein